jgi:hypothetical protein
MSALFLLEVDAGSQEVRLAHACPSGGELPIVVRLGDVARARLADGETFPTTGRCLRCGERVFASLIDPAARAARRAAAKPDPSALRAPTKGHLRVVRGGRDEVAPRVVKGEPCPACGVVPDSFGLCRCSL